MSRIGKKIVPVPAGVKVSVKDRTVEVAGAKTKLTYTFRPEVKVTADTAGVKVELADGFTSDDRQANASWGSTRAHIANMIVGVTKGYEKNMHVVGTGWSASVAGKNLKMIVGFANPIILPIPEGLTVVVDKTNGDITPIKITGSDKQLVGQFASTMRGKRKPEPYNGKGVKYAEEVIQKKQGKQFGS
jgi:large subunit ribosomal protein L6